MLNPMTLNDAFDFVKKQKQYVLSSLKWLKFSFVDLPSQYVEAIVPMSNSWESILDLPKVPASARLSYKKISYAQMQDRRMKCLCYFYEEKWQQGHRCVKPRLYLLQQTKVSNHGSPEMFEQKLKDLFGLENTSSDVGLVSIIYSSISLHAMVGTPNLRTMHVQGVINMKQVIVLIDIGSTHNFLDVTLIQMCKLAL